MAKITMETYSMRQSVTFDELHVFRADSITKFINNMNATVPLLSIKVT